jgi:hypothetical protein
MIFYLFLQKQQIVSLSLSSLAAFKVTVHHDLGWTRPGRLRPRAGVPGPQPEPEADCAAAPDSYLAGLFPRPRRVVVFYCST